MEPPQGEKRRRKEERKREVRKRKGLTALVYAEVMPDWLA
jgi:hypothetical protein